MSSLLLSLPDLYHAYENWIIKNPDKASDFETTAKWISYFIAGRINNSHVVSELVYALSNLLVLFNDRLISNGRQLLDNTSGDRLKLLLTILEYSEVFLELSAQKLWGKTGKWLIIVSVQVFKCASRLMLIYQHKETIIQNPPIQALERTANNNLLANSLKHDTTVGDVVSQQLESISFTLKSGKVIRKVDASPSITARNWKPLEPVDFDSTQYIEQVLAGRQLIAEMLYVTKPIVHLGASACFGYNTWNPWFISLIMDLSSLHLYSTCKKKKLNSLTKTQRLQLSRRTVALIMYLLRSPFYDRHSKRRIESFLNSMSNNLPLVGLICKPLMKYVPFWQGNYFYMWST